MSHSPTHIHTPNNIPIFIFPFLISANNRNWGGKGPAAAHLPVRPKSTRPHLIGAPTNSLEAECWEMNEASGSPSPAKVGERGWGGWNKIKQGWI